MLLDIVDIFFQTTIFSMHLFYLHCFIQSRIITLAKYCIIHKFSSAFSQLMQFNDRLSLPSHKKVID